MRRIINGKRYDTETATEVCAWTPEDWANEDRTIYRKSDGEYFIVTWHNLRGRRFWPLTRGEAARLAESHMDPDDYEAEFGECPE